MLREGALGGGAGLGGWAHFLKGAYGMPAVTGAPSRRYVTTKHLTPRKAPMLTLHASMPALTPMALRRLEMAHYPLFAVMGGAMAWLFGPGGLMPALTAVGGVVAAHLAGGAALRGWARHRALRFIPRREWRAAWRDAAYAAPVPAILARSLLFGLAVPQFGQGRPAWALDSNGWAAAAICTALWFLFGLWNRGSAAADAWAAAGRGAKPEP